MGFSDLVSVLYGGGGGSQAGNGHDKVDVWGLVSNAGPCLPSVICSITVVVAARASGVLTPSCLSDVLNHPHIAP